MKICQLSRIRDVNAEQWDALLGSDYPFMRHGFLDALEHSGSVCVERGWEPAHLVVLDADDHLQAALPLYRKMHSYGEYVFDFQWAEAWERSGRHYYPKYLAAVPFSPVQGPRLLARCEQGRKLILEYLDQELERTGISGMHLLFNTGLEDASLQTAGWVKRLGCQFHWFNRSYQHFDDFLAACNSRKRKNFRKERLSVADQGISFHWLAGEELNATVWDAFYPFYAATYLKRGQHPYLTPAFFHMLGEVMPEAIRLVFARHDGHDVAGAFFLADGTSLYGRYWGCLEEYDRLHFETCFYQGMERCIAEGLERFDAGAQGEHKLIRGFEPVITQSWHKLQEPLHDAVADFLVREQEGVRAYQLEAKDNLPYRQTE
ncbi:MAG: putative N-acyltransferase [Halopseudomonas sp.]|jgi:predicted N-acyltransferase|uniref:GNAT family N-acetyltransferase n=1 Tax=Halopseudomonas sp. TaxID=2901191 RepID=UPI0039E32195